MHRLSSWVLSLACAAAAASSFPAPARAADEPTLVLAPDGGFWEDAWAFDADGARVVLVHNDGAHVVEAQTIEVATGERVERLDLSRATTHPEAITPLGGGRLFVIARGGADARAEGALVGEGGKVLRRFGPADEVALATLPGERAPVAVTFETRVERAGATVVVVVADVATGAVRARRSIATDVDGTFRAPRFLPVAWLDGYTRAVGKKRGAYDATRDRMLNDGQAEYDVVAGRLVAETAVEDIRGWLELLALRAAHPNQRVFAAASADGKRLELVTADHRRVPIALDAPLARYAASSLQQELGDDGRLVLSLTVDPLNPAALARKKQDPELIDFYAVDATSGQARRLLTLPRNDRPFAWHVRQGRLGVLRKHQTFARGGTALELYEVAR